LGRCRKAEDDGYVPFLSSIVTVSLAHFIRNLGTWSAVWEFAPSRESSAYDRWGWGIHCLPDELHLDCRSPLMIMGSIYWYVESVEVLELSCIVFNVEFEISAVVHRTHASEAIDGHVTRIGEAPSRT